MERKNREQRRRERYGPTGTGATKPGAPWPDSRDNPALGRGGDDQEAHAGTPDQGVTRTTGPGTGGASEPDGRTPHHEGAHPGTKPKG